MITQESLQQIARQFHTPEYPNVVREYVQHIFLSELYKLTGSDHLLFKGGTALRIVYGSSRFSEDLDFSLFQIPTHQHKVFCEDLFTQVLASIEKTGIKVDLGLKPDRTREGYFGDATFQLYDYPSVSVVINISSRNGRVVKGEVKVIPNDFIPTYNIIQLPQIDLVEEKVFNALPGRKKERDFYDLYFIMRKGLLATDQKKRLANLRKFIVETAPNKDFQTELSTFLPTDQHNIIRDFPSTLEGELNRQVAN